MKFDWKDGLLFTGGFVLTVAGASALHDLGGVDLGRKEIQAGLTVLAFGPLVVRRVLFGAPQLPEPRKGIVWSLVSMLGLLAMVFGIGVLALSTFPLARAFGATPDFEADARAEESAATISVTRVGETPEEQRERQELEARDREAQRSAAAARARALWTTQRDGARMTLANMLSAGLALVAFGTFCTWARYPKV